MTEDGIVTGIQELIAAGEHLDEIPGKRGARIEDGGAFILERRFGLIPTARRVYFRGTPEHREAVAAGRVDRLPPPPAPARAEVVEQAERTVGQTFPRLLRRLYLEVGNGGFGPGYGLLGLHGGYQDDLGETLTDSYRSWHSGPSDLPDALVPLAHWGCGIYSFVDCADDAATMWACDPNPGVENDVFAEPLTLSEWFASWLDGRLRQPALIEDAGEWRPATDEDWANEEWDE
jgi:hypothetical protein